MSNSPLHRLANTIAAVITSHPDLAIVSVRRDNGPGHPDGNHPADIIARAVLGCLEAVEANTVRFVIHLKPGTNTTYIVTPELERLLRSYSYFGIYSVETGTPGIDYEIEVPVPVAAEVARLLVLDERIELWSLESPNQIWRGIIERIKREKKENEKEPARDSD